MAATMTTIAREAGVSPAVISRLLRGDPTLRISTERRQQILEVKDRLGGIKIQRRQSRRQTRTALVPINRVFSAEWIRTSMAESQVYRSMEETLKSRGFRLHIAFFDEAEQAAYFESIIRSGDACDGLVLLSGVADQNMADLLRTYDFPHVSWSYDVERLRMNTVRSNTGDGFHQVIEHLYQLGHRRIGYAGPRQIYRYPLMVAAMTAAALPLDDTLNCWIQSANMPGNSQEWRVLAREAMNKVLDDGLAATAMVCSNDEVALGVVEALREHGLRPGRDVSVVGHDNLEMRGRVPVEHPILTTVDNPTDRIGHRAAELLLNQILHGQTQIVHERLPAPLIVRESTGPCPEGM